MYPAVAFYFTSCNGQRFSFQEAHYKCFVSKRGRWRILNTLYTNVLGNKSDKILWLLIIQNLKHPKNYIFCFNMHSHAQNGGDMFKIYGA